MSLKPFVLTTKTTNNLTCAVKCLSVFVCLFFGFELFEPRSPREVVGGWVASCF